MASSDVVAVAVDSPTVPPPPPSRAAFDPTRAAVPREWWAIAVALVVPWWLPLLAETSPTFYKEWLFVVAFAFAGLLARPLAGARAKLVSADPLLLAAVAGIAVLAVQAVVLDGVARRSTLMMCSVAFFAFSILLGRRMNEAGDDGLAWIAKCLLVAALGSCLLAAAQVVVPGSQFVLPRAGGRLSANIAQANHFCDLLWIGCVAAVHLFARGTLRLPTALVLILVMQAGAATSGSRMAWIYAIALAFLGILSCSRRDDAQTRRLGLGLLGLVGVYAAVTAIVSVSGALNALEITSAEQRAVVGASAESSAQRLWFWRVGLDAAVAHPLLGVGAGRFAGQGLEQAMRSLVVPRAAADAQAHNIFVQLAAEAGIPLALIAAAALIAWARDALRSPSRRENTFAVFAMAAPILIHANLEHPLGYMYFLGLLGLLFGQVRADAPRSVSMTAFAVPPELLRYVSFSILAVSALAYLQFMQVERAMQVLSAQVRTGAPPQPTRELNARLAAVPAWSLFGDDADLIALISALPTSATAGPLGDRCERVLAIGPTPRLLARCAATLQVAGRADRASYFANGLCKLYPEAAPILIESMTFVERTSPVVENLRSTCVERTN